MKKLLVALSLSTVFFGCGSEKLELPKAQKTVEGLIQKIDQEQYDALPEYYTEEFNASEPMDQRVEKLKQLKKAMGKVESVEFLNSKDDLTPGEQAKIALSYKIKRSNITSVESFVVVEEEGKYKVAHQSVKSE